jgi:hypothetical protein
VSVAGSTRSSRTDGREYLRTRWLPNSIAASRVRATFVRDAQLAQHGGLPAVGRAQVRFPPSPQAGLGPSGRESWAQRSTRGQHEPFLGNGHNPHYRKWHPAWQGALGDCRSPLPIWGRGSRDWVNLARRRTSRIAARRRSIHQRAAVTATKCPKEPRNRAFHPIREPGNPFRCSRPLRARTTVSNGRRRSNPLIHGFQAQLTGRTISIHRLPQVSPAARTPRG